MPDFRELPCLRITLIGAPDGAMSPISGTDAAPVPGGYWEVAISDKPIVDPDDLHPERGVIVLRLGRSWPDDAGPVFVLPGGCAYPKYVDFRFKHISRRHAQIRKHGDTYLIENWEGKTGVQLFEETLLGNQSHSLHHGNIFTIGIENQEHYRIAFHMPGMTVNDPLYVYGGIVRIYGEPTVFTNQEYCLLEHLKSKAGALCAYDDLIKVIWPDATPWGPDRKRDLETLVVRVRRKIEQRTGGFSFIQTVTGRGYRLII